MQPYHSSLHGSGYMVGPRWYGWDALRGIHGAEVCIA